MKFANSWNTGEEDEDDDDDEDEKCQTVYKSSR
jgi:hypothetical protein